MTAPSQEPPDTTAVVISHNHADYVIRCLESVRDQTVAPSLVVFADDGSSDDSFHLGQEFVTTHFERYELIHHAEPVGLCRTLNEALHVSEGGFLHEIAADDYWLPHKTEQQLQAFSDAGSDAAVVFGDATLIDERGEPLGGTFLERFVPAGLPPADELFAALLRRNFLPGMSAMIRRDVLLSVGGWDEDLFYEDWDLWLRLAERWRLIAQRDVVAAYRILPTSMSNARGDDMWLSKLVISQKWAGRSARADAGALWRAAPISVRRAGHGDLRYARGWLRLLAAICLRRVSRRRPPPAPGTTPPSP